MPKSTLKCEKCGRTFTHPAWLQKHVAACKGEPETGPSERGSAKDLSRKMDAFRKKLGRKSAKAPAVAPATPRAPSAAAGPSEALNAAVDAMRERRKQLFAESSAIAVELADVETAIQTLEKLLKQQSSRGGGKCRGVK